MLTKQRDHVATGASEPLRAGETGQQCSSAKFRGHLRQLGEPAVGQRQGQLELDESLSTDGLRRGKCSTNHCQVRKSQARSGDCQPVPAPPCREEAFSAPPRVTEGWLRCGWAHHIPHGEAAEPKIRAALTRALIDEGELDDTWSCDDDDIGLTK